MRRSVHTTRDRAPIGARPRSFGSSTPDDGPVAGVAVDAVKLADDGSGDLIVRCHEALGDRRHVLVVVADGQRVGGAWRCNLLEEPDTPLDVADGVVELGLHPFELVTVRLRRVDHFDGRTA